MNYEELHKLRKKNNCLHIKGLSQKIIRNFIKNSKVYEKNNSLYTEVLIIIFLSMGY